MSDFDGVSDGVQCSPAVVRHIDSSGFDWGGYGRRGALATKRSTIAKKGRRPKLADSPSPGPKRIQCAACGRWYNASYAHKCAKADLTTKPGKTRAQHANGHNTCACGAMKAATKVCCFKCSYRDEAAFDRLDDQLKAGITVPEMILVKNRYVTNPAWLAEKEMLERQKAEKVRGMGQTL
jgi:hypothetical protein